MSITDDKLLIYQNINQGFMINRARGLVRNNVKSMVDLMVSMVGFMAARILALIISVLIARVTGVETFGEYSLFMAIFVLVSEVPNAFDTAFIRLANSGYTHHNPLTIWLMSGISKAIYIVLIGGLGWLVSPFLAEIILNKPQSIDTVRMALISGSLLGFYSTLLALYQQQSNFYYVSLLRPVSNLLILIVLGILIISNASFELGMILDIYLATTLVLVVVTMWFFIKLSSKNIFDALNGITSYFNSALILVSSSMIGLIATRLDIFILTANASFEEVGQYGAALRIAVVVAMFTAALTTIYVPKAAATYASSEARKKYHETMFVYGIFQTLLAVFVYIFMDTIIYIIFGEEYINIDVVASVLLVQVVFESYGRGYQALIQCSPKPSLIIRFAFIRLILSAVLMVFLIPLMGVTGAAISVTVVSAVITVGMAYTYYILLPKINRIP